MKRKWEQSKTERVCSIDIDGVLNLYPKPWVDFINQHITLTTGMTKIEDLRQAKETISYQTYKDLKFKYRESGIKERLEIRPGAKELTNMLKAWGYKIVILTSRPFEDHRNLQLQTIRWLNNNQIPFDQLINGKDKYVKVMSQIPHLKFHLEDHRYYANLIGQWGYRVYLVDSEYNQGTLDENVMRINDLLEVLDNE